MPELGALSGKAAASLAGLAAVPRESGAWQGRAFIRGGRARARRLLYMPAPPSWNPDWPRCTGGRARRGGPRRRHAQEPTPSSGPHLVARSAERPSEATGDPEGACGPPDGRLSIQVWPEAYGHESRLGSVGSPRRSGGAATAPQGVSGPPGGLTSTISGPSIQLIRPLIAPSTAPVDPARSPPHPGG